MMDDWMKNLEVSIPALLEDGIKVLVYAGEYDLMCNWLGKHLWLTKKPSSLTHPLPLYVYKVHGKN